MESGWRNRTMHDYKSIKSAMHSQTHMLAIITGPDARELMRLLQTVIQRENVKRRAVKKHCISYQIETAAK